MDSATLAKQIQDYDATKRNSLDVLNEALGKYGVPEIRTRVSGLRSTLSNTERALDAVDPSVTGRTQGSNVTEAQRQRQVANERAPIMDQYGDISNSLSNESRNLSEQEQAARMVAEASITDWNTGRTALRDRYDTTYQREQDAKAEALERERLRSAEATARYQFRGTDPGTQTTTAPTADNVAVKVKAMADVDAMLGRRTTNPNSFIQEVIAISKSAGYGNTYDQAKLELLRVKQPGLFNPDGSLRQRAYDLINPNLFKDRQKNLPRF